jgi:hypothetical protein
MTQEVQVIEIEGKKLYNMQSRIASFMNGRKDFGSFDTNFYTAIKHADSENLYKLAKGFPYEILSYLLWFHGEKYEYFESYYKLKFNVKHDTKYIHAGSIDIKKFRANISKTWNEMVDGKLDSAIVEFIVNGSEGSYMLQRFGEIFDIEKLKRDPHQTDGYWDDWTYQIQPQCETDIKLILEANNIPMYYPKELDFIIDFTEGGGDLVLMMVLPEDYWSDKNEKDAM